ncbi:MAG: HAMP domain-containing sensor histidine kinase [Acidobacteriaceae bacterium]|nr:HAMP domain-containing sensor histidine kinase [Acidobacteriaceae bacterium]
MVEGTLQLNYGKVNLHSMFDRLRQFIELRSQLKHLALTVRLDGPVPPWVRADKRRLMQVLLNLAHNAIKYTFNGEVKIVGKMKDDSRFVVEISDTGLGIDPGLLDRIFSMFGLIDKKVRSHETGIGIGLYLCKRIVDTMEGTISIDSVQGRGTKCTVEIPTPPIVPAPSTCPVCF